MNFVAVAERGIFNGVLCGDLGASTQPPEAIGGYGSPPEERGSEGGALALGDFFLQFFIKITLFLRQISAILVILKQ